MLLVVEGCDYSCSLTIDKDEDVGSLRSQSSVRSVCGCYYDFSVERRSSKKKLDREGKKKKKERERK